MANNAGRRVIASFLRWLRGHWSSVVLVSTGLVLLIAALYQRKGRDGFAVACVTAGTVLVVMGALHPRILKAKWGPGGGEVELSPGPAVTARFAEARDSPSADAIGPNETNDATRWLLATQLFVDLLENLEGPLEGCAMQLYLYDDQQGLLLPILEAGHPGPSPGFAPGQGAAGRAWESGEYIVADGLAVSDTTFDLSPAQRERYKDLTAVAAMPVTNARGRVISVLSAATRDPDSALLSAEGFERHVFLAGAVARILVDLLKWFDDEYDDQ